MRQPCPPWEWLLNRSGGLATLRPLQTPHVTHDAPLKLKVLEPFAVGGRRLCFVHPHEPNRCVKVLRTDERRTVRHKKTIIPAHWRREYDNNAHEKRILEHLERRIGPGMARHLPRSYGMAATDMGPGLVLDLVRDYDGGISRSIRELITTGYDLAKLRPSFESFGRFLSENLVLTRSLLDHNLVVKMHADGPGPIFLIDGLGDPAWLPLSTWIPALGRAKIARRIDEAWSRFEGFAARGGVSEELRRTSSWDQGFLRHRG
jgi:PhoP regulatory network protein YrbL